MRKVTMMKKYLTVFSFVAFFNACFFFIFSERQINSLFIFKMLWTSLLMMALFFAFTHFMSVSIGLIKISSVRRTLSITNALWTGLLAFSGLFLMFLSAISKGFINDVVLLRVQLFILFLFLTILLFNDLFKQIF